MTDNKRNTPFQVLIVGSGKLASELLENLKSQSISAVFPWVQRNLLQEGRKVVVHAGSGRELSRRYHILFTKQLNSDGAVHQRQSRRIKDILPDDTLPKHQHFNAEVHGYVGKLWTSIPRIREDNT